MHKIILRSIFFCFLLDVYPGLGISEIRDLFFGGPIWMRLNNSRQGLRWAGAGGVARRDKTKEHM